MWHYRRVTAVPNRPAAIDGSGRDYTSRRAAARRPGRADPDAASAARLIRGTRCEAAANRSRHPDHTRVALAILRLARRPGGGARALRAIEQLPRGSPAWSLYNGIKQDADASMRWKHDMDEELFDD